MSLQHIKSLVEQGQCERARAQVEAMLRDHVSAEALMIAASLCDDGELAIRYARRALAHDPKHTEAYDFLRQRLGENSLANSAG
ncbi:MAG: hypothetical protein IT320_16720 [Anaerolineae bacterium]|nr:hypothetical protein [Anaerolineae bacterium]